MRRTGKPRHNWKRLSGTTLVHPPTLVQRCAYCNVLTKAEEVETSRIGVHSASFAWKNVPIYSTDGGVTWQWEKPVCTGKPAKVTA